MMEAKNVHLLEITLLIGALGRAAKGLYKIHMTRHHFKLTWGLRLNKI